MFTSKEDELRPDISVNNSIFMHIFDCRKEVSEQTLSLLLIHIAHSNDPAEKGLSLNSFDDLIDFELVLKGLMNFYDVWVVQF